MTRNLFSLALIAGLAVSLTGCPGEKKSTTTPPPSGGTPTKPDTPDPTPDPTPEPPPAPKMKQSEMKSPWKSAKVGDWVEFKPHFGQSGVWRHEVTAIKDGRLTFKMSKDGKAVRSITMVFSELDKGYNDPKKLDAVAELKEVDLKVGDKTLKCTYYKRKSGDKETETWLSWDVPLNGGVVKSTRDGDLKLNIVGFGRGK